MRPPAPDAEARSKQGEILVQDIRGNVEHLLERVKALELFGIDSCQSLSLELSTIAHLLAVDAMQSAGWVQKDLTEAVELFGVLLEDVRREIAT